MSTKEEPLAIRYSPLLTIEPPLERAFATRTQVRSDAFLTTVEQHPRLEPRRAFLQEGRHALLDRLGLKDLGDGGNGHLLRLQNVHGQPAV